jgi:GntR family transcriptional regulator/MocR family aminotransferase
VLRPWDFKIIVRRRLRTPVYLQIVHALVDEIRRGRLTTGTALPGTRELAESLAVNRKTVVQAYKELEAQGWVESELTRGTFISSHLPSVERQQGTVDRMPSAPEFPLVGSAPVIPLQRLHSRTLSFDDGAPDTRQLPVDALARAYRRALIELSRRNGLTYGDPRGSLKLRAAVSSMLNVNRGLSSTADHICLTRGSQMAIYLAARILVGRNDSVVLEELTYPPARESFRCAGAEVAAVGLDAQGMRVDELERICRRKRVRAVYITPHHQFPTTVMLSPERRLRLFTLAAQFGFAILEDDYDHEFHFAHQPMLPLASADSAGRVVYIGSMSKLLSPSLRLGYIAASRAFIERVAAEIMMIDRQGDPATEAAVADLIEMGELHRHARKMLKVYAERRALLAELLHDRLAGQIEFDLPDGGLAIWARFAAGVNVTRLAELARHESLNILPGNAFCATNHAEQAVKGVRGAQGEARGAQQVQALRLGFASLDARELRRAVDLLRAALAKLS